MEVKLIEGGGGGGTGRYELITRSEVQVQFRSKAVLLSHGGKQELHPDFYKHFSCMLARSDRVILSD